MADTLLRMLLWSTIGLALVLVLRRPARRLFGTGPAFTLWLLPVVLAGAPLLPEGFSSPVAFTLPGLTVIPDGATGAAAGVDIDWSTLLVVLWLVGATVGLGRLAWQYGKLCTGMRNGSPEWVAAVRASAPRLDVRRLRVHAAGPAVLWALPRARVLLPADFRTTFPDSDTRELVLQHELAHIRRGDPWWTLAMEFASALLWFHPLAWLARPRFRLDQELACDAAALRTSPARTALYARALLASVATRPVPALIPWLAEPQLKERIAMLTSIPPGTLRRRAGVIVVAALLAGGLSVASGQTSVRAASGTESASPTPSVDVTSRTQHPPAYPPDAIRSGEQGTIMLEVTVDAGGNVTGVEVDPNGTNGSAELQTAAIQAATHWKFNPGIKDGKTMGGTLRIPVKFSLDAWESTGKFPCPPGYRYEKGDAKSFICTLGPASAATS